MTAEKGMLVEHNTRRMLQALGRYTWKAGEGWIGNKISPVPLPSLSLPSRQGEGFPGDWLPKALSQLEPCALTGTVQSKEAFGSFASVASRRVGEEIREGC